MRSYSGTMTVTAGDAGCGPYSITVSTSTERRRRSCIRDSAGCACLSISSCPKPSSLVSRRISSRTAAKPVISSGVPPSTPPPPAVSTFVTHPVPMRLGAASSK